MIKAISPPGRVLVTMQYDPLCILEGATDPASQIPMGRKTDQGGQSILGENRENIGEK